MDPRERIIIALDIPFEDAVKVVNRLDNMAVFYKVGLSLYLEKGEEIIDFLLKKGKRVFLDLKFYDIPHQVYLASKQAALLGVHFLTVHASGGPDMIEAAKKALEGAETQLLAVTILTSIPPSKLQEIGYMENAVTKLADVAFNAGADGIVLSGSELKLLRPKYPQKTFVVPGVRPSFRTVSSDDQKRTVTPQVAFAKGADYIVVGRPVTLDSSPETMLKRIIGEVESILRSRR